MNYLTISLTYIMIASVEFFNQTIIVFIYHNITKKSLIRYNLNTISLISLPCIYIYTNLCGFGLKSILVRTLDKRIYEKRHDFRFAKRK